MWATTLLPTGTWVLDPGRAQVTFSGRMSKLAPMFRASFGSVSGTVDVAGTTRLCVEVDVTSVSTGNRAWDELLRGLDPFAATRCPRATYRGTADLVVGDCAVVEGELELRGVRQPVALAARVLPHGDEVLVTATGTIDRRSFGVRCDLPGVGRFVPAVMQLDIVVTAVRAGAVPQQR
jgi:polyisoprenoid-binding protein YceI